MMIELFDDKTQEKLLDLEKTQKDFWNISRVTAEFIYNLVVDSHAKNVIEVGTSNGYSGIWLGKALKKTGGKLITIEFYDKRLDIAKENFKICDVSDVIEPRKGDAITILEYLPEDYKCDVAFIDANKAQYIRFLELIAPHLNVGGYILADNVISHQKKVQPFLDKLDSCSNFEHVVLPLPAGLSIAKKLH